MNIVWASIDSIRPYEKNPRKNESAIDKVAGSLIRFGFKQPIVIDKAGIIAAGHTRFLAAKKIGLKIVPIIIADDLTPEEIKAYRLADNRTHEDSSWDQDLLAEELNDLKNMGFDLEVTGFDDKELNRLLKTDSLGTGEGKEYSQKFEVIAECADESDQEAVYKLLTSKGYPCRVLSM